MYKRQIPANGVAVEYEVEVTPKERRLFKGDTLSLIHIFRKLDIASDPVLFEIQQVLFTAVAAVGRHRLQGVSKRILVLFQNGDQRMIVGPVITHISVDYKVILYCCLLYTAACA